MIYREAQFLQAQDKLQLQISVILNFHTGE